MLVASSALRFWFFVATFWEYHHGVLNWHWNLICVHWTFSQKMFQKLCDTNLPYIIRCISVDSQDFLFCHPILESRHVTHCCSWCWDKPDWRVPSSGCVHLEGHHPLFLGDHRDHYPWNFSNLVVGCNSNVVGAGGAFNFMPCRVSHQYLPCPWVPLMLYNAMHVTVRNQIAQKIFLRNWQQLFIIRSLKLR